MQLEPCWPPSCLSAITSASGFAGMFPSEDGPPRWEGAARERGHVSGSAYFGAPAKIFSRCEVSLEAPHSKSLTKTR